jgi:hypothetical protein
MVVEAVRKLMGKGSRPMGGTFSLAASSLVRENPNIFGSESGAPSVLSRQNVANIWKRHEEGEKKDTRGRHAALPQQVVETIATTLRSVIKTHATRFTIHHLRPTAMGVVAACGFGHMLNNPNQRGKFSLSREYLRLLLRGHHFTFKSPVGNTRHCPPNWDALCTKM